MSDEPDIESDELDILPSERATVDAGSREGVRRRETAAKRHYREAEQFWKAVFSSEVGRREMWGILASAHAFDERFACGPNGSPQSEATWFHAGEQALGQRLFLSWQRLDRDGVWKMQDEHDPRFASGKK